MKKAAKGLKYFTNEYPIESAGVALFLLSAIAGIAGLGFNMAENAVFANAIAIVAGITSACIFKMLVPRFVFYVSALEEMISIVSMFAVILIYFAINGYLSYILSVPMTYEINLYNTLSLLAGILIPTTYYVGSMVDKKQKIWYEDGNGRAYSLGYC